jgi:hypothetical protein
VVIAWMMLPATAGQLLPAAQAVLCSTALQSAVQTIAKLHHVQQHLLSSAVSL